MAIPREPVAFGLAGKSSFARPQSLHQSRYLCLTEAQASLKVAKCNVRKMRPPAKPAGVFLPVRPRLAPEVNDVCKKLEAVQKKTNDASEFVRSKDPDLAPSVHGTKVHKKLADAINGLGKANFRAEVSIEKGEKADATYGTKGSIRVDVLENRGNGTVCVYDIKTGREGLSQRRMHQIAATIAETFKIVPTRIIVTQVRPIK